MFCTVVIWRLMLTVASEEHAEMIQLEKWSDGGRRVVRFILLHGRIAPFTGWFMK